VLNNGETGDHFLFIRLQISDVVAEKRRECLDVREGNALIIVMEK